MYWALARVSFRAAKIVSCNKKKKFMVYDQKYHNCSTLVAPSGAEWRRVAPSGAEWRRVAPSGTE
jgi:hypothetical protein